MARVDVVTNRLADEVTRNGVAGKAVILQQRPFVVDVFLAADRSIDVEMIAPAGEFDAVVAHLLDERGERFEGKVGPLAGEQGDRTGHGEENEGDWFRRARGDRQGERLAAETVRAK